MNENHLYKDEMPLVGSMFHKKRIKIKCVDCGENREIFEQDKHLVKRCKRCQRRARRKAYKLYLKRKKESPHDSKRSRQGSRKSAGSKQINRKKKERVRTKLVLTHAPEPQDLFTGPKIII